MVTVERLSDKEIRAFHNAIDADYDALLDIATRAVGELQQLRAMVKRLEELAARFDVFTPPDGDLIQKSQAAHDIRSAMKGA